jgi:hypothetical protein
MATRQSLDGQRLWVICPVTGNRARVLYLAQGGDAFASRQARGLVYRSTRETPWMRQITAAQNIRSRLKGSLSVHAPVPRRPARMHQSTYERLVTELKRLEAPLVIRR